MDSDIGLEIVAKYPTSTISTPNPRSMDYGVSGFGFRVSGLEFGIECTRWTIARHI